MVTFNQSYLEELRHSDRFLSDTIIEFYFSYISSLYPSDSIRLVSPTISFFLANIQDDDDTISECLDDLNLGEKQLVMFPVSDGGSHWSLLVYYKKQNLFFHHDSFHHKNEWDAFQLYQAVKGCLKLGASSYVGKIVKKKKKKPWPADDDSDRFWEAHTPQQTNGYDCGLYVMAIARAICRWYCCEDPGKGRVWIREVGDTVDVTLVSSMRLAILQLIEEASCGRLGPVSCTIQSNNDVNVPPPITTNVVNDCETFGQQPQSPTKQEAAADCGIFHEATPSTTVSKKEEEEEEEYVGD